MTPDQIDQCMRYREEADKLRAALQDIADGSPLVQCQVAHPGETTLGCNPDRLCVSCQASQTMDRLRAELKAMTKERDVLVEREKFCLALEGGAPEQHAVHIRRLKAGNDALLAALEASPATSK
jgi:hypothetical protein